MNFDHMWAINHGHTDLVYAPLISTLACILTSLQVLGDCITRHGYRDTFVFVDRPGTDAPQHAKEVARKGCKESKHFS
jgi:hypothetical protein